MREATEIILNPKGNHHQDGRHWIACQREVLRELAPAEVTLVESAGEAARAAKQAALRGYRKIVAVGEGATGHGVVNGVMELAESHRAKIKLGYLSFSHPDHWSRTLGLPRGVSRQLEILSAGHVLPYDVGRVDCQDDLGGRRTSHFLNGVWFGVLGGLRADWRHPERGLLKLLPRMGARLRSAVSFQASRVRLESQGRVLHEGPCAQALVMGGRYYPYFGPVAPQADPADGLLELAWLASPSIPGLAWRLLELYCTRFRRGPARLPWQSVEHVRATSLGGSVEVEADGLPVGRLPANISVHPKAVQVMVAPVAEPFMRPAFTPLNKASGGRLVGNIKSAAGL